MAEPLPKKKRLKKLNIGDEVWYPILRASFIGLVVGFDPDLEKYIVRTSSGYQDFDREQLTLRE